MSNVKQLPQHTVPELQDGIASDELLLGALTSALAVADPENVEWGAAHVYLRKNSWSMDRIGGDRNESYGSLNDDIVLQVTVRVSSDNPAIEELVDQITRGARLADLEALEHEQDQINAAQAALDERRRIALDKRRRRALGLS